MDNLNLFNTCTNTFLPFNYLESVDQGLIINKIFDYCPVSEKINTTVTQTFDEICQRKDIDDLSHIKDGFHDLKAMSEEGSFFSNLKELFSLEQTIIATEAIGTGCLLGFLMPKIARIALPISRSIPAASQNTIRLFYAIVFAPYIPQFPPQLPPLNLAEFLPLLNLPEQLLEGLKSDCG